MTHEMINFPRSLCPFLTWIRNSILPVYHHTLPFLSTESWGCIYRRSGV